MGGYTLEQVKQRVLEWYQVKHFEVQSHPDCKLELSTNESDIVIIHITFKHCLVQIMINDPGWAPYRYVYFEALNSRSIEAQIIYFFYDIPEVELNEVIEELDYGFELCLNYEPNNLEKKFINKKGRIRQNGKRVERFIHSSDLSKIEDNLWEDEFICIGTQFHYLIVENNSSDSFRVLPEHYEINEPNSSDFFKKGLLSKIFKK